MWGVGVVVDSHGHPGSSPLAQVSVGRRRRRRRSWLLKKSRTVCFMFEIPSLFTRPGSVSSWDRVFCGRLKSDRSPCCPPAWGNTHWTLIFLLIIFLICWAETCCCWVAVLGTDQRNHRSELPVYSSPPPPLTPSCRPVLGTGFFLSTGTVWGCLAMVNPVLFDTVIVAVVTF